MPQTVMIDGRTEEEYRADVARAVADTDREVFDAAMGNEELDNDGDRSLEEMGEGPGGDVLEDDEDVGEQEQEEEVLEAEGEEEGEPEPEEEEPEPEPEEGEPEPVYREPQPRIPSYRLQEEAERARAAEQRIIDLERELALMRELRTMQPQQPQAQPQPQQQQQPQRPAKPDRYLDETAYDQWMLDEGRRLAREEYAQMRAVERQDQMAQMNQRVETSFAAAANGEHRHEFLDAYDRLTHLDHRNPRNRDTVMNIASAADPAAALFEWWDGYNEALQRPPRGQRIRQREELPPRHEVRLPNNMGAPRRGPPSLNSVGGGGPGQRIDPEMLDDSDAAVFRYATQR